MCEYCDCGDEQKSIRDWWDNDDGIGIYINWYEESGFCIAAWTHSEIYGKGVSALAEAEINYCPMCGRDLRDDAS